jgi:predicted ester cyclase
MDDDGNVIVGPEKFKVMFRKFVGSFPDIQITVDDMISEGDKIAARATVRLSHTGDKFQVGPEKHLAPSGKVIEFSGMTMNVIRNGQLVQAWNCFDFLGFYTQLGVV